MSALLGRPAARRLEFALTRFQIRVLGPLLVEVCGQAVDVPPLSARALALPAAADGAPVPASRLHRELRPRSGDHRHRSRASRTEVQQRITALRRVLDPAGTAPEDDELVQRNFSGLRTRLSVVRGDLFEHRNADLVIGFCDTFDTSTERNELISAESVQGRLLHRLYAGDAKALDRELRRGLRGVDPVGRESARDKPKGKRLRFPVGTVVPLPYEDRLDEDGRPRDE